MQRSTNSISVCIEQNSHDLITSKTANMFFPPVVLVLRFNWIWNQLRDKLRHTSLMVFLFQATWSGKVHLRYEWALPVVSQIKGGLREKPLGRLPSGRAGEFIYHSTAFLRFYQNPASLSFQQEMKISGSLGVLQPFCTRLRLKRGLSSYQIPDLSPMWKQPMLCHQPTFCKLRNPLCNYIP